MYYEDSLTTVICGPMKSGKSKKLFETIDFLKYKKIPFFVFKPDFDTRTKDTMASRYLKQDIKSIVIDSKNPSDIYKYIDLKNIILPTAVLIDETQFFDNSITNVIKTLNQHGIACYIAGLDSDACKMTFGPMGDLLAWSDVVIKLNSVCEICSGIARKTITSNPENQKHVEKNNIVIEDDNYFLATCLKCCYRENNKA